VHGRPSEHDPEKWIPVFGKGHAPTIKVERDDDSKKSHLALAAPLRRSKDPYQTPEQQVDQLLQHLVNAVVLGGTYALLGIGLTLIFGIMRVVNFTHGELYAFGAYTVYLIAAALGLNFFFGLVVAVVAGMLLGAMIEVALLRPMRAADIDTVMLVMIGAWIVMQNTELLIWGGVAKAIVTPFPDAPLVIGPVSISWLRVFVLVAALLLILAAYALI